MVEVRKLKILNKNILREFKFSLARFISITTLLALGVFILIGLKITGSDMRSTANNYYNEHNMADAVIKSNLDFTKSDQEKLTKLNNIKNIEFTNSTDTVISGSKKSIRIQAKTNQLSKAKISSGIIPKSNNEIVLNEREKGKYEIGEQILLKSTHGLKNKKFKIVGFVTSSDYLLRQNLASTNVGTGKIDTFGIVKKSAFKSGNPTIALIKYNNLKGSSYSNTYEKQVEKNVTASENTIKSLANKRQKSINNKSLNKLDKQIPLIRAAYGNKSNKIIEQKEELINRKSKALTYKIQSRNDYNNGYNQFGEDAKRVDVLSNTFPLIFFAVAILVVLITMSRMGEEKRIELGTLRALGYSKFDSMKVFLLYRLSASILGTTIGAWLGITILPRKIFNAYAANFTIPNFQTNLSWSWIILSFIITLSCTILPAVYVAGKSLKDQPAVLMLPKQPKMGSKIILENIPFIWKHLSFNYKVTFRNLFRYKIRSLMTIIGVLGCTALLITGFGIKDSLNGIISTQYKDIIHYDIIGIYNNSDSLKNIKKYNDEIKKLDIKDKTTVYYENVTSKTNSMNNNQEISLIVPKSQAEFKKFVTLRNSKSHKKIILNNHGAVITQKLAKIMNVKVGDKLTIKNSMGKKYHIKVSKITEMYAGHNIYLDKTYYNKVFGKLTYNASMIKLNERSNSNVNLISRKLIKQSASLTVVQSGDAKQTINNILHGLNNLVLIIIIAASLLAFVVLFTLTNINVSERIRELSTIKVLGFYPLEVIMYIYRETIILTVIGIGLGFIAGDYLHNYIMQTLPPETAMANMSIFWTNLATSGIMTIIFSLIVMYIMSRKINNIDMLGALKSVD